MKNALGGKVCGTVDLTELWQTLDMCNDRPEKFIGEAMEPTVN